MKYLNHVKSGLVAMAYLHAPEQCFTGCEDDVVNQRGSTVTSWRLWTACMAM